MRKFLKFLAVAALALLPELAYSAPRGYFVSTGGAADTTGGSIGTPCNLASAMAAVQPGDTVYFNNGEYSAFPVSANSGTDTTSGRIVMLPKAWAQHDAAYNDTLVRFTAANGVFDKRNIQLEHVTLAGKVYSYQKNTVSDTIGIFGNLWRSVKFVGSVELSNQKYCWFDSCRVDTSNANNSGSTHFWLTTNQYGNSAPTGYITTGKSLAPRFTNCTFNMNTGNQEPTQWDKWLFMVDSGVSDPSIRVNNWPAEPYAVRYPQFINNTINIVYNKKALLGEVRGFYAFHMIGHYFSGNHWNFTDNSPASYGTAGRDQMFRVRDRVKNGMWLRDTFTGRGRTCNIALNTDGEIDECEGNKWRYCDWDIQVDATAGSSWNAAIEWSSAIRNDTFDHNTIKTNRTGIAFLAVEGTQDSITFNTIYSGGGLQYPALEMHMSGQYAQWLPESRLTIKNNIFYVKASGSGSGQQAAAVLHKVANRQFEYDGNLYYFAPDDGRAVYIREINNPGEAGSAYGPMTVQQACQTRGIECYSRYGTPAFRDSVFATWDARPTYYGAQAFGDSGYVGAYAYGKLYTFSAPIWTFSGQRAGAEQRQNGTAFVFHRTAPDPADAAVDPATIDAAPDSLTNSFLIFTPDSTSASAPAYTDTSGKAIDGVIVSTKMFSNAQVGSTTNTQVYYQQAPGSGIEPTLATPSQTPTWVVAPFAATYYGDPWRWGQIGSNTSLFPTNKGVLNYTSTLAAPYYFGIFVTEAKADVYGSWRR